MPQINELSDGMQIEECFALKGLSLRETKTGNHYIRLQLSDATGSLVANLWDASEEVYQSILGAEVVKVRGTVETYRDSLQLKLTKIRAATPEETDLGRLVAETPLDRGDLRRELERLVDSIEDRDYRDLIRLFLDDESFREAFCRAPAARENHHAYLGGLLEHTVSVLRICDQYARLTPTLRRDLLLAGAFFHDMGKIEEMRVGVAVEYTDEGLLLGHLTQGVLLLERRLAELPSFPRAKRNLLFHLILSHHGQREYGSPVLPAVPEAFALHHVDNLDAKVFASQRFIHEDSNPASQWTERSWMLDTRLYKG